MILFYPAYNIRNESKIRLDNARQYGDEIIHISYSEKTCNILKNSKLYKIKNGGHGFKGTTFVIAVRELLKFINNKTV